MKIDLTSNSSLISTIDVHVSFSLIPKFYSAASGPFSQILSMTIDHHTSSHTCHHTDTARFSLGTFALFPASFLAPTSDEFTTGLRSLRKCCPAQEIAGALGPEKYVHCFTFLALIQRM